MTGVLIVSYNRPDYFKRCLDSFRKAVVPHGTIFLLIDDCSTDPETIRLFNEFTLPGVAIIKHRNSYNRKIASNIQDGFENLFQYGCDIVMNFDSDAIIKPNAIGVLATAQKSMPGHIVTGFNSTTKNANGSDRHPIVGSDDFYHFKKSVGGINMVVDKPTYNTYLLPALKGPGNWDHEACKLSEASGTLIACLYPSVVQHIGFESSMGHSNEAPDVAEDFFELSLPNVTLIGADTNHFPELEKAARISISDIMFGGVKLLQPAEVKSGRDYNYFCMKKFGQHVDTDFALIIQWDGYVLNYKAWEPEFLEYDYIGATWLYKDNLNVGNGGFSLRSKKLLDILGKDEMLTEYYPEDHHICRTYRDYLEAKYDILFAPEEVANRFAIEAYGANALAGANRYNGQFGFHGFNVDYAGSGLPHIPSRPVSNQNNKSRQRGGSFSYR